MVGRKVRKLVSDSTNGNGRRAIITRDSLVPLSLAILVGGVCWAGGSAWTSRGATIERHNERHTEALADHETRIKLAEARLELWRRRVESALQIQLPDPEPASDRKTQPPADPRPPAPIVAFGALGMPPPGEPGG